MSSRVRNAVVIAALAISFVLILWVTLLSRLGSESRHFYPPFWSYRAIANGSGKDLLEVIGNVILFIPIGIIAALILQLNIRQTILFGFSLSLLIESCQWFFWLGSFEIDDLIHNTIGAAVGTLIVEKSTIGKQLKLSSHDSKKNATILVVLILILFVLFLSYQGIKVQTMVRYAAMNDREDGTKNLLVLSPDPKYIGETDFSISYNDDGSVMIEGSSENRAWIEIGRVTLTAGSYSFSGLLDVPENTVAIELEYFDKEQNNYIRLTQDVGPINDVIFELNNTMKLRALIGLYAKAEGEYIIRPVIYKEE